LSEYFDWLFKTYPTKAEPLGQCLETLRTKDIVYETISDISDELFNEWGCSAGVRLMVRSHMKKWDRSKAKRRD
jgi:hypothetical protein